MANIQHFELLITGNVKVIRSGGGLGESVIGATHKNASFNNL